MMRGTFGSLLILLVLIAGCNRNLADSPSPESLVIFPPPPDTTRLQYLTHFSSSDHLKSRRGVFHSYLFGAEEPLNIIKPYGVAVKGPKVYICDTGLAGLEILNLEEGSFRYFIPGGKGQLQLPINCFVDQRGYLFVADASRRQIVVFDAQGLYVAAFGETENFKPTDVLVCQDKIWVCNVQDHSLYAYNVSDYSFLGKMPELTAGEEGFIRQPTNICCQEGVLYVSDFGDFNIKKFSVQGAYLGTIGSYGNVPGMFTRPKGIALDQDQNLYAVDAAFENVQIFNQEGALLMHFGGSYHGAGAMGLPAAVEVSYENLSYFEPYVDESFQLKYLVYVTNQYGPAKVNVYGFVEEKTVSP
jgi:DNA-binding beta-propeller fold protein YncE